MGYTLIGGTSGVLQDVDAASKGGRVTLYGPDGNPIAKADRGNGTVTPGATPGLLMAGADYKTPLLARASSDGSLLAGQERTLLVYDNMEGTSTDPNKWIQTTTTQTITQTAAGKTINAGSSTTGATGAQEVSHRFLPFPHGATLVFRSRQRHTAHFANSLVECGFGSPATATTATIPNGAYWRKDGSGQYVPVISINSSEILGTAILNATFLAQIPATDYAVFEVILSHAKAIFNVYKTTSELVFTQSLDLTVASSWFTATHLQAFYRHYNNASGTSTAVQVIVTSVAVYLLDVNTNRSWGEQMAGMSYSALTTPVTYVQTALYANNAANAAATPSNTAAAQAAMGGHATWSNGGNSFGASDTLDLIIFGVQLPAPYGFMLKGIRIDSVNLGAANGAAIYTIEYFLAVNGSALSLATGGPYSPMKKVLGFQTLANAAAVGASFGPAPIDIRFGTGIYIFPGRYFVLGARVIGASISTASQTIRTACDVDGYFE